MKNYFERVRRGVWEAGCAILLASFAAGCAPKIRSFSVLPREICAKGQVKVNYTVSGTPSLVVSVKGDPENPGREILSFELTSKRFGKETFAVQDVTRFTEDSPALDLVFRTVRAGDSMIEAGLTNTQSSELTIAEVSNPNAREIKVEHAGKSLTLAGNAGGSQELAGAAVNGVWKITSALMAGEKFGEPGHSPPDRLRLKLILQCSTNSLTP